MSQWGDNILINWSCSDCSDLDHYNLAEDFENTNTPQETSLAASFNFSRPTFPSSTPNSAVEMQNETCYRDVSSNAMENSFELCGFGSTSIRQARELSLEHQFFSDDEISAPNMSNIIEPEVPSFSIIDGQTEESLIDFDEIPINIPINLNPLVLSYQIIEKATGKGRSRLIDNLGYTYTISATNSNRTRWRCSVRNVQVQCLVSVTQRGENFIRGKNTHVHAPNFVAMAKLIVEIRERGLSEPFRSASAIAEASLINHFNHKMIDIPRPKNLARLINRHRQRGRPKDPKSLEFDVSDFKFPEGFLKADVIVGDKRHLIFATDDMLNILSHSKNWYVDATFKVIKKPFTQLFTIHAYVASPSDSAVKQIPLLFACMSRRTIDDYEAVMKKILCFDRMRERKVSSITIDFEAAMWVAFDKVFFGNIKIYGCHFHLMQAIYRHITQLGMANSYKTNGMTTKFCLKLMALPFLAPAHIPVIFAEFKKKIEATKKNSEATKENVESCESLLTYFENTWLKNKHWTTHSWSVFNRAIRTNNCAEGWHRKLNSDVSTGAGLHVLVEYLYKQSDFGNTVVALVTEDELKKCQKPNYIKHQRDIFDKWHSYMAGMLKPMELIKFVTKFNRPTIDPERQLD